MQASAREQAGTMWRGADWNVVLCSATGEPPHGSTITHRFLKELEDAGLPRVPFHNLRHAAASYMLVAEIPLRTVMEVLGHSNISTTANIYGHLTVEATREATERISEAIWA